MTNSEQAPVGATDRQLVVQLTKPTFWSRMNAFWIRLNDVAYFLTAMQELTW